MFLDLTSCPALDRKNGNHDDICCTTDRKRVLLKVSSAREVRLPRGLALGSVSSIVMMPVEFKKRTVMGMEGDSKCGALKREAAIVEGVRLPVVMIPRA